MAAAGGESLEKLEDMIVRAAESTAVHVRAAKAHAEVDRLGLAWLANGRLSQEEASRLTAVLAELAELYRAHLAIEDTEVFPLAAAVLSALDRQAIGGEMALRRGLGTRVSVTRQG